MQQVGTSHRFRIRKSINSLLRAAAGNTKPKRQRGRQTIASLTLRVGMGCFIHWPLAVYSMPDPIASQSLGSLNSPFYPQEVMGDERIDRHVRQILESVTETAAASTTELVVCATKLCSDTITTSSIAERSAGNTDELIGRSVSPARIRWPCAAK